MAESVDALVSNTSGAIRAGSIPALGTRIGTLFRRFLFFILHNPATIQFTYTPKSMELWNIIRGSYETQIYTSQTSCEFHFPNRFREFSCKRRQKGICRTWAYDSGRYSGHEEGANGGRLPYIRQGYLP